MTVMLYQTFFRTPRKGILPVNVGAGEVSNKTGGAQGARAQRSSCPWWDRPWPPPASEQKAAEELGAETMG